MEFDNIVARRSSVRDFKNRRVGWRDVLDAIDAALQGPYAGNYNNLRFLIVEDKNTIKDIAGYCDQIWIASSPLLIVVCSDDTHLENMYGERGRVYSRQQAGAAIMTIIFKLVDLGVSSCWVGAYSDELVKTKLKIPQHIQIEAIIATGYALSKGEKKHKKELENALYWEEWFLGRRPTLFEEKTSDNY